MDALQEAVERAERELAQVMYIAVRGPGGLWTLGVYTSERLAVEACEAASAVSLTWSRTPKGNLHSQGLTMKKSRQATRFYVNQLEVNAPARVKPEPNHAA